ncbi:MAG: DUF2867 domain-containing protein [Propionibacteriaceae bacterium]|nr:DUF2867 domain-containing protein [Propionibacteriaceae bacterium]
MLPGDSHSPSAWAEALFADEIPVVDVLMKIRDAVVRPFGLAVSSSRPKEMKLMFPILSEDTDEVILGAEDKHLTFAVGVTIANNTVSISTLVTIHNTLGKLYWAVVRLFHPVLVRATLRATPLVT